MERGLTQKEMLAQVNQLWSMLGDMAENNPESYQKFTQRHMKEEKEFMAPPEPNLCILTKMLEMDNVGLGCQVPTRKPETVGPLFKFVFLLSSLSLFILIVLYIYSTYYIIPLLRIVFHKEIGNDHEIG